MFKKSFWTKPLLVIISFLAALVILEFILRLGGFLFLFSQEQKNQRGLNEDGLFIVMCVGESTTALGDVFSYPVQLEQILNQKIKNGKVKVINKGIPAINMQYILDHLEENLDKYQPDLVVTMIGINDEYDDYSYQYVAESEMGDKPERKKPAWYDGLRVVKLFKLARKHLFYKMKGMDTEKVTLESLADENRPKKILKLFDSYRQTREKLEAHRAQAFADNRQLLESLDKDIKRIKDREAYFLMTAGDWYAQQKDFTAAQDYYHQAIKLAPDYHSTYIQMGICLREQKSYDESIKFFSAALKINVESFTAFFEMARTYDAMGEGQVTGTIYKNLLKTPVRESWAFMEMGDWFLEHQMSAEAIEAYRKAAETSFGRASVIYYKLGDVYAAQGKKEKAEEYYQKAIEEVSSSVYADIFEIYNKIADKVLNRGVKLVCMQYPLRSINLLQRNLKRRDEIIFVENKENFENALKTSKYYDYFYDSAGGDFGHCTFKGNRLIAAHLADVISSQILPSGN